YTVARCDPTSLPAGAAAAPAASEYAADELTRLPARAAGFAKGARGVLSRFGPQAAAAGAGTGPRGPRSPLPGPLGWGFGGSGACRVVKVRRSGAGPGGGAADDWYLASELLLETAARDQLAAMAAAAAAAAASASSAGAATGAAAATAGVAPAAPAAAPLPPPP